MAWYQGLTIPEAAAASYTTPNQAEAEIMKRLSLLQPLIAMLQLAAMQQGQQPQQQAMQPGMVPIPEEKLARAREMVAEAKRMAESIAG